MFRVYLCPALLLPAAHTAATWGSARSQGGPGTGLAAVLGRVSYFESREQLLEEWSEYGGMRPSSAFTEG